MKTDVSISIGARIRHFRKLAGLSQLQLSEKVQCEPSTLAHYETGKNLVSMTRLIRIAEVLEVDLYQFFIFHFNFSIKSKRVERSGNSGWSCKCRRTIIKRKSWFYYRFRFLNRWRSNGKLFLWRIKTGGKLNEH